MKESDSTQSPFKNFGSDRDLYDLNQFRELLINWGDKNFRQFPWRFTRNPYQILIAETLLHRTQAKQVVAVYLNFIEQYPDLRSLFEANPGEVQEIVKSLGLFWRSELIHDLANQLVNRFNGEVPKSKIELLTLPGVGDYIASSLLCFAFDLPEAIIDTNVLRVITRVFGIPFRDSLRRNQSFKSFSQSLVDSKNPRGYNFAILDLASMICLPQKPKCEICPLLYLCRYSKNNLQ